MYQGVDNFVSFSVDSTKKRQLEPDGGGKQRIAAELEGRLSNLNKIVEPTLCLIIVRAGVDAGR